MPTLKAFRQEMHVRSRHATGRTLETPTSITATTLVVASLATGTVTAGKYGAKWVLRPDAALSAGVAVDRVRLTTETGFASATGTLTHAGTNYTDTTPGTESVELTEYEPYLYDDAVQVTLQSLTRSHRYEMPTRQAATRYWLDALTWVSNPRDIQRVTVKHTPVLSRNRHFEQWNGVSTAGALTADGWTLAGAAATYARSTTQVFSGQYSAAITRAGTDATLTQTVGLLETGIIGSSGSLRSNQVTGVAVVWSAVASQVRVQISDGITTTSSSYHTGGSGWEEISTANTTISATATNLTVAVSVEGSNTVCYVDDCYLVWGPINDSVRRDDYGEEEITVGYQQGTVPLAMITPQYAFGSQLILYSMRPYNGFDPTRLTGGLADADSQDAPLTTVALGALWRLYDGLAETVPELRPTAARWRAEYEALAAPHLDDPGDGRAGLVLPPMMASGGRRF